MLETIQKLTIGDIVKWVLLVAGCLSTFLEFSKIKVNPWSALARLIGKAINKEVLEQLDEVKAKQSKLEADVDGIREDMSEQKIERQEEKIVEARIRILRFGDECREHVRHSKEHWDQTMRDITKYEQYCEAHPEFENNVTVETSKYLKELYHKCMVENDFL